MEPNTSLFMTSSLWDATPVNKWDGEKWIGGERREGGMIEGYFDA